MQEEVTVQCPWWFEHLTLWMTPDDLGRMTIDCEVCCRPWAMTVALQADGGLQVHVVRE